MGWHWGVCFASKAMMTHRDPWLLFRVTTYTGPGFFHGPMMVAHAVALLAYMRPEGFFSGGGGGVGRGMGSKMKGT